jgi:hypothetical protein
MPTRRTPIKRPQRRRITPAVVELFKLWQAAEDRGERLALERELEFALGLRPWEFIAAPDEPCCHPHGTAAAEWHPHAQSLFRILAHAAVGPAHRPGRGASPPRRAQGSTK